MGDEYRMKRSLYELGCMIVASVSASMEADTMEEQATFDAGTEMNINELKRRDAAHAALEAQLADADEVMAGQVARARAAYEQRCAELEAQLSAMEWVAKTHAEQSEAKSRRIAALEAQLAEAVAERWEPVADRVDCMESIHYTVRPDGDHIIVTPTWGGTPHRLYLGKAHRLCRRVTGAQPGEGCDE